MQLAGVIGVLLLPWASSFAMAAGLYALTSMFNLGTRGMRYSAMFASSVKSSRSWSSRSASFLIRLGAILWPGAFGHMIDEGEHVLPFYLAAAIQSLSTWWYGTKQQTKAPL
jgi:hypothetical protein